MVCLQPEREKVLPARVKRAEKGYFGRAGRVLYRVRPPGCERGEFCPAARLEADAELVERSGEMLGLVAESAGG